MNRGPETTRTGTDRTGSGTEPGRAQPDAPKRPVVVALMGPTAAGKTEAALRIADGADVDLISVDSAMVYRRMDIGTAKPESHVLERYPHALVDILEPVEAYSAARFVADADQRVRAVLEAGRVPLLVGGTMLYFRAFKFGLNALPQGDAVLRDEIAARGAALGWPALHRELAARDPVAASRIDVRNGRRIQRALEVLELTGRPIGAWWAEPTATARERLGCELLEFAIVPRDRSLLHMRIGHRIDEMMRRGLVEEVRGLRGDPALSIDLPAMRAVGYRQVWRYLDGAHDLDGMIERLGAATRQVAKRQLTWLRRWEDLAGVAADATEAAGLVLQYT